MASCVVFVFLEAVGAAGVPVNVGDASLASVLEFNHTHFVAVASYTKSQYWPAFKSPALTADPS